LYSSGHRNEQQGSGPNRRSLSAEITAGPSSIAYCTTPPIKRHTRIGGLFLLLFAQPLSRIVAMRTSQISHIDGSLPFASRRS
jgi:hypothetical protein